MAIGAPGSPEVAGRVVDRSLCFCADDAPESAAVSRAFDLRPFGNALHLRAPVLTDPGIDPKDTGRRMQEHDDG
jgi:hypothetical protein